MLALPAPQHMCGDFAVRCAQPADKEVHRCEPLDSSAWPGPASIGSTLACSETAGNPVKHRRAECMESCLCATEWYSDAQMGLMYDVPCSVCAEQRCGRRLPFPNPALPDGADPSVRIAMPMLLRACAPDALPQVDTNPLQLSRRNTPHGLLATYGMYLHVAFASERLITSTPTKMTAQQSRALACMYHTTLYPTHASVTFTRVMR